MRRRNSTPVPSRKSVSGSTPSADKVSGQNQDNPLTWTVSHEMNHREPPLLPAGTRKALRCLSLLLVPALTLDEGLAGTRLRNNLRTNADALPYLPVLGSPGLRVEEAPLPPPDLVTRPAAAAPPVPAQTAEESSVAAANVDAARSAAVPPDAPSAEPKQTTTPVAASEPPVTKAPPPILPDSTRPVVRPEDFLPYFQIPGTARHSSDATILVPAAPGAPAPAAIPPSSATYTQSPR